MNTIKKLAATAALSAAAVGVFAPAASASPVQTRPTVSHLVADDTLQLDLTTLFSSQFIDGLLIVVSQPMSWEWT